MPTRRSKKPEPRQIAQRPRMPLHQNALVTLILGIVCQVVILGYTLWVGDPNDLFTRLAFGICGFAILGFLAMIPRTVRVNRRWRTAMAERAEAIARLQSLERLRFDADAVATPANETRRDRSETEPSPPRP